MSSHLPALQDAAEACRIIAADSGRQDWRALVADLVMRTASRDATGNRHS
jgi:hypothetical protein